MCGGGGAFLGIEDILAGPHHFKGPFTTLRLGFKVGVEASIRVRVRGLGNVYDACRSPHKDGSTKVPVCVRVTRALKCTWVQ